jgi:hypothetical protein
MATAFAPSAVDEYREEADRFLAALDEAFYLHFAGHAPELELEPIYERHSDLTRLDACRDLEASVQEGTATLELWRFACEGYLGNLTRESAETIARLESTLEAEVDGETVGFRMLRAAIANEPDRERRFRLERARTELVEEHLNPVYADALARLHKAATELGAPNYCELYERFDFRLAELGERCEELLASTEDLYVRSFGKLFEKRLGIRLEEATRPDLIRLFRAAEWDDGFPARCSTSGSTWPSSRTSSSTSSPARTRRRGRSARRSRCRAGSSL